LKNIWYLNLGGVLIGKKNIVVDDEVDIVNMLKDYFEIDGYEVMTEQRGMGAVKKQKINLISYCLISIC